MIDYQKIKSELLKGGYSKNSLEGEKIFHIKRTEHPKAEIWTEVDNAIEKKIPVDQIANKSEVRQQGVRFLLQLYLEFDLSHADNEYAIGVMYLALTYGKKLTFGIVKRVKTGTPKELWLEAYSTLSRTKRVNKEILLNRIPLRVGK